MASGYSRCAKPKAGPVLRTAPASTGFTLPSLDLPHVRCCLGSLQLLTGISLAVIAFPCLESSLASISYLQLHLLLLFSLSESARLCHFPWIKEVKLTNICF
uniref:uncharacterized protein LOC106994423 isoform X3 n=1 Tax=Macaca mulatta TaxID=9544 RepID=UPI0010A24587|nr:uncharacterized protein LOC106994423 isoform X3 [Macaca mulatta]